MVSDWYPVIAQRSHSVERVSVVAPGVTPPRLLWVCCHAVEFHAYAVVLISHVLVIPPRVPGRDNLTPPPRKGMPAFHVPLVAEFEGRVNALPDFGERVPDIATPAYARARRHRGADAFRSGQTALTGLDRPGDRVFRGRRHVSQVKNCLFKCGLRRQSRGMSCLRKPRRVVDR